MNAAAKPVILLVQDDPRVRRLIEGYLAQRYRILTASGLGEALARALEAKPDVILSDQDDLVLSIRSVADLDRVPVVRLMPVNDAHGEVHALRLEVRGNLTEPFPPQTLGHELEAILQEKLLHDERHELANQAQRAAEASDLGSFEIDVIRDKVRWSPELKHLFGAPSDQEVLDLEWVLGRIHPEDRERLLKVGTAALAPTGPRRFDAELRIMPEPGKTRWILVRGRASSERPNERATSVFGTVVDITELKTAEGQVRESETRLSRIITSAADAIISIDSEQRIVIFNEGAEHIFGWRQEEVLGRPLDILLPARFREGHRAQAQRFAGEGKSSRRMGARRPIRGLRKSGQEFPAEASISKVDSGEGVLSTVVLRDVTEQKREEHERDFLLQASAMLGSSLEYDALIDGIIALSLQELADCCVVSVFGPNVPRTRRKIGKRGDDDPALRALLESFPSDMGRSQSLFESREPILLEKVEAAYLDARESTVEASLLRVIAPRSVISVPLAARGQLLGVITLFATGERRFDEAALSLARRFAEVAARALAQASLYRAEQLAVRDRDQVLSIVAHDLRSPLSAALLAAGTLTRGRPEGDRRAASRRAAEAIRRSLLRANRLIDDLLDITRIEAGSLSLSREQVAVAPLLDEVLDEHQEAARAARLELALEGSSGLPDLFVDRDRMLQIFENLIGNAIKFTPGGGRIVIGATSERDNLVFFVSDSGLGIPPEDLPHLFDRFWQARRADRRGAGLGLPIVQGLVEAHGGRVWVESQPSRGSTFRFTIPQSNTVLGL